MCEPIRDAFLSGVVIFFMVALCLTLFFLGAWMGRLKK